MFQGEIIGINPLWNMCVTLAGKIQRVCGPVWNIIKTNPIRSGQYMIPPQIWMKQLRYYMKLSCQPHKDSMYQYLHDNISHHNIFDQNYYRYLLTVIS